MAKETCELCGKKKKADKMFEYYISKRSNHFRIMYRCKNCRQVESEPNGG